MGINKGIVWRILGVKTVLGFTGKCSHVDVHVKRYYEESESLYRQSWFSDFSRLPSASLNSKSVITIFKLKTVLQILNKNRKFKLLTRRPFRPAKPGGP